MIKVSRAQPQQAAEIAVLFDLYRRFYQQAADLAGCEQYIEQRLANDESIIFTATDDASGEMVGFTQLYHSWCSVAMQPIVYLYDLFVAEAARRQGVAKLLMERARQHAGSVGAERLTLETALDNVAGQTLYESLGWKQDKEFFTYHLPL